MGRYKKQLKSKAEKITIKKNDMVCVISGDFSMKGKTGKVLFVDSKKDRVTVEGMNFVKRHQRPNQKVQKGGIIEREGSIHVSNVMPFCEKCDRPVRVRRQKLESTGRYVRCCAKCGEMFDKA